MIQFKRGTTATWRRQSEPLADGQPGFDKEKHKIKIGNGKDLWDDLPDISGLSLDEILDSEENAKKKAEAVKNLGFFGTLFEKLIDKSRPVFTYGTEAPDEDTKGRVYLQYIDSEPEVDYVVESSTKDGWHCQKWHSGYAVCSCRYELDLAISEILEGNNLYYCGEGKGEFAYPYVFKDIPYETATIQSPGGVVWLANHKENTTSCTGVYGLVSTDSQASAKYHINIKVEGFIKKSEESE